MEMFKQMSENIAKMTASMEKGKLPSQSQPNPNIGSLSGGGDNMKPCQAVSTLRSGKQIQKPDPPQQPEADKDVQVEEEAPIEDIPEARQQQEERHHHTRGGSARILPASTISSTFDSCSKR